MEIKYPDESVPSLRGNEDPEIRSEFYEAHEVYYNKI